ncbi:MAG: hypothetical protein JRH01_21295 [Deltaproteobacteria bacterium]|nr:hypothetical protein [Deltaproteobacteria bacterium]
MKSMVVLIAAVSLALPSAGLADADANEKSFATSAIQGAKGFLFQKAVDQYAGLILNDLGLEEASQFLFPVEEGINYDKIAGIVANAAHVANIDQDIDDAERRLGAAMDILNDNAMGQDKTAVHEEISNLALVMSTTHAEEHADKGIGIYVLAANARLGAYTVRYKTSSTSKERKSYKLDMLNLIDEASTHVEPYFERSFRASIEEAIVCRGAANEFTGHSSHNWHLYEAGKSEPISGQFASGDTCSHARAAYLDLVSYSDWSDPRPAFDPPTWCVSHGDSEWFLFIRSTQPLSTDWYAGFQMNTPEGVELKGLQSEAAATQAWFKGFLDGWANVRDALNKS